MDEADDTGALQYEEVLLRRRALIEGELERLRSDHPVSARPRAECPVCLVAYEEGGYPSSIGRGAFRCDHAICYRCSRLLLLREASDPLAYRCPMCRAERRPEPPGWLEAQRASAEVRSGTLAIKTEAERALMRALEAAGERVAMLRQTVAGTRPLEPAREREPLGDRFSAGRGESGGPDSEAAATEQSSV